MIVSRIIFQFDRVIRILVDRFIIDSSAGNRLYPVSLPAVCMSLALYE